MAFDICLCGSGLAYLECCGQFHNGDKTPATAEGLMRSRFTAYALRNTEYLMATWDATTRPKAIDFSKETAEWLRLIIEMVKKGGPKDSKGLVEFKAFYRQDGVEQVMSETSRFTKQAGRWFYLGGVVKLIGNANQQINEGKNAPCSCGSGKKFKRCCGAG
jgi:SEC-C motif-containing protein